MNMSQKRGRLALDSSRGSKVRWESTCIAFVQYQVVFFRRRASVHPAPTMTFLSSASDNVN